MITTRRTRTPLAPAGLLLAALLLALAPAPARAASAVELEARALLGGRYQAGGWAAVSVTLVNGGTPTEGWLASDTDAGTVRRFVELPAGSRKVVTLHVQPSGFQRQIEVRYEEPNGTVRTTVEVEIFEQFGDQVAIIGDFAGALRAQLGVAIPPESPQPIALGAGDLPDRPEVLAGLATIVWAGDGGALGEGQRQALERWVADGGQLIVVAGPDWQARTAGFADLLPLSALAAVDGVDQSALAAWAGSDEPPVAAATVATGLLRPDARSLVVAADGSALLSMRPVGAGRILLFGTDLAVDAFRGWSGSAGLWSRVLPTGGIFEAAFGGGVPDRDQRAGSMEQALNTLPSLEVPPAEWLLAVIVGYILLIGPVSYLVLHRLDRRELAWVTAPVLVVVFSACSYGIGLSLKGSDLIVNQIAVVRSSTAGSTALVETYAGVFAPTRIELDLVVEADALFGRLRGTAFREGGIAAPVASEQGDPSRLRGLPISAGGYEYLRADGVVEHEPMLAVTWSYVGGDIVGTVTNVSDGALDDVAYISTGGGEMIGALAPGASAEFRVDALNANGTSASDQVYGFGGFDASTEERRRLVARRGVIDALVGYGGEWAAPGSELGGRGDRGPYLVGWRTGEGPMPILAEGAETQRYAEIVEVVAVRPDLGRGEVVVGPGQMIVGVTTDGDATDIGPGTVALGGGGSATFGISLPLMASDIEVSQVTILAGLDPSTVLSNQGGFGGWWPPGYLIELWDPAAEAWVELGDLGESAQYRIENPASAVSDTGRIVVRVSVEQTDPNFGEPGVFVSATVTGVIGP